MLEHQSHEQVPAETEKRTSFGHIHDDEDDDEDVHPDIFSWGVPATVVSRLIYLFQINTSLLYIRPRRNSIFMIYYQVWNWVTTWTGIINLLKAGLLHRFGLTWTCCCQVSTRGLAALSPDSVPPLYTTTAAWIFKCPVNFTWTLNAPNSLTVVHFKIKIKIYNQFLWELCPCLIFVKWTHQVLCSELFSIICILLSLIFCSVFI